MVRFNGEEYEALSVTGPYTLLRKDGKVCLAVTAELEEVKEKKKSSKKSAEVPPVD